MQKVIVIVIVLMLSLTACGRRGAKEQPTATPETQPEVIQAQSQGLTTKAEGKAEVPPPKPATEGGSTSPVAKPLTELGASPIPTPLLAQEAVTPPPGTEVLVEQAKKSLIESSGGQVAMSEIKVVSVESVEWPDSSLGCPQEGMMYAQVITPGYVIVLEAGGQTYEFHANTTDQVTPCFEAEQSQAQPGGPGLEIALAGDTMINYQREGGFAGVRESWTIHNDGRVVGISGEEWRIPPETVTELLTALEEAGFFEMSSSYMPDNICCDRFTHRITAFHAGQVHTVTTIDDAPGMPPELAGILGEINDLLLAFQ